MKILLYIVVLLLFHVYYLAPAFANNDIDKSLSDCIANNHSVNNIYECTMKAQESLQKHNDQIFKNLQTNLKYNDLQKVNNYKHSFERYNDSTENSIIKILNNKIGLIYQEFIANIRYEQYKSFGSILSYINNSVYAQEKYISPELKECLAIADTNTDKVECYNTDSNLKNKIFH